MKFTFCLQHQDKNGIKILKSNKLYSHKRNTRFARYKNGGAYRIWTDDQSFADSCLTTWLRRHKLLFNYSSYFNICQLFFKITVRYERTLNQIQNALLYSTYIVSKIKCPFFYNFIMLGDFIFIVFFAIIIKE